ncbi:RDD family protein [Monaibacterium marinum]|uniref:RDD family protein n=1 Tax=Pontivivens marinum TaxID=1690039 RepID=A0A2C9CT55_9RHOB|nr:RDD family protein [Monaibacterium marinum]SOH94546.1 RDD family protein [Monaibacterium marinum]
MTQTRAYNPNYRRSPTGLPDPQTEPQFYDGVAGKRLMAWIFDIVLITALWFVFGILTLGLGWLLLPFWAVISFIYRTLTISGRSATWGMRMMGIEFRDGFGQRFGMGQALVHTGLYTVSLMFVATQLISVVLMAGTARGQALHDIPLGSTAINSPSN